MPSELLGSDTDTPRSGDIPKAPAPAPELGDYSLLRMLGRGGWGDVWLAASRHHGETVALKRCWLQGPAEEEWVRREVAALRWIQHPGVVRVLEEGRAEGCYWFAMELVEGPHFPASPIPWAQLQPWVLQLFDVLVELQRLGIVHSDIKPENMRVGRSGRLVLLDFGIAGGLPLGPEALGGPGSRSWQAPEQAIGMAPTSASDLYSAARCITAALGPDAPPFLHSLLRRCLDPTPGRRPPVSDCLDLLCRAAAVTVELPRDLERLFVGHRAFHHLPERAAALLRRRAPDAERIPVELGRWASLGVIRRELEQWRVDGRELAWLCLLEEEQALQPLVAQKDWPGLLRAGLELAERALEEGRPEQALSLLERCSRLPLAWSSVEGRADHRLAHLAAVAAVRQEVGSAMSLAICVLRRLPQSEARDALDHLLVTSEGVLGGWLEHAAVEARLGSAGPYPPPLDNWAQGLLLWALRGTTGEAGREAQRLGELEGWADTAERRAALLRWWGHHFYRRGDFAGAARCHLESRPLLQRPDARLFAARAAAEAMLERGSLEEARDLAEETARLAAERHLPLLEAGCVWVARQAGYRLGQIPRCRPELVAAAAEVAPVMEAQYALAESVFAAAEGRATVARELARRSAQLYGSFRATQPELLMLAFAASMGCADSAQALAGRPSLGLADGSPDLALQIAVLLARCGDLCIERLQAELPALWARRPLEPAMRMLEVMERLAAWQELSALGLGPA